MSFFRQKLDIINQLKSYTSISESIDLDQFQSDLSSLRNASNNPIAFLIELTTILLGQNYLEKIISDCITLLTPNIEVQSKQFLKRLLIGNIDSSTLISIGLTSGGINIPIKRIDFLDIFKFNPNSSIGKGFYPTLSTDMVYIIAEALRSPGSTRSVSFPSFNLSFNFNESTNLLNVSTNNRVTINTFFNEILDDPNFVVFDSVKVIRNVIDYIYNYLGGQKTYKQNFIDEVMNKVGDNILNERNIDEVFKFNDDELNEIDNLVKNRQSGKFTLDLGCNNEDLSVTPDMVNNYFGPGNNSQIIAQNAFLAASKDYKDIVPQTSGKYSFNFNFLIGIIIIAIKSILLDPKIVTMVFLSKVFQTDRLNPFERLNLDNLILSYDGLPISFSNIDLKLKTLNFDISQLPDVIDENLFSLIYNGININLPFINLKTNTISLDTSIFPIVDNTLTNIQNLTGDFNYFLDYLNGAKDIIYSLADDLKMVFTDFVFIVVKEEINLIIAPIIVEVIKEKINTYINVLRSLIGV